jgi:Xaa-Pro aminopeptidase
LREAARISSAAHCEAMRFVKPGVNENQVLGILIGTAHLEGSIREGYNTIVASGPSATTLHYVYNDQVCHAGDLLLIDAGFEKDHYTADITRTFPVSGKFTDVQRRVYEAILKVEVELIAMIKPGILFKALQETAIDRLTQAMIDLKILKGSKAENIQALSYRKYYMHGVSHWLGLDVHDVGIYKTPQDSIALEEGMVFTIEPGLYFPVNDEALSAEYRGIGIRIEDNVVVTATGCEVLTTGVPKEPSAIEALMAEPSFWNQARPS